MDLNQFLADHAISEEVGNHGRYVRFEHSDFELVGQHFEAFDPKTKRLARTVAGQSGGFIIVRRGWNQEVPPQLRPDESVFTSNLRKPSYHPSREDAGPVWTKKGKRVLPLPLAQRERHLAKWHDGENVEHLHFHHRPAKYVLPPGAHGKRLDVPMPERIARANRVFFVIEGSLKTDAILSTGEVAFGVPSVTLWHAPELDDFIREMGLRGKQVVIVPDADWVKNPMVVMQAMMCRTYLRDRGVSGAIVAAPPLDAQTKGVDDYLHAGHSLDGLAVLEREAIERLDAWRALYPFDTGYGMMDRAVNALTKLPLHATREGKLIYSISMFAKILRRDRKTARKAIRDLQRAGIVTVEGSLDAGLQYEDKQTGAWYDFDWDERPRITIKPEFRATEKPVSLRDWPIQRLPTNRGATFVESRAS